MFVCSVFADPKVEMAACICRWHFRFPTAKLQDSLVCSPSTEFYLLQEYTRSSKPLKIHLLLDLKTPEIHSVGAPGVFQSPATPN